MRQSQRFDIYRAALARLEAQGLLYPCFCSRRQVAADASVASAPQGDAGAGEPVYAGTCRALPAAERAERINRGLPYALRLDIAAALAITGPLTFTDRLRGRHPVDAADFGDVVLARRDVPVSYHLAVTVDDAVQGITEVTRGEDLLPSTPIHRTLQALLDLPEPLWHHHALIRDAGGRRLSKRAGDLTIRALRAAGHAPDEVLAMAQAAG
jgi:glutamyl-Q tRNA(Asp) synthetase